MDSELPTVLVTGASGFLGRHLCAELLDTGSYRVRGCDLVRTWSDDALDGFDIADLRSRQDCQRVVHRVDAVFHCAALTDPFLAKEDYFLTNVCATRNLLQACLAAEVCQFVLTSSSAVVDHGGHITDADERFGFPWRPMDWYAWSKQEAEKLVLVANGRTNAAQGMLATCILRPHAVFGPGDRHFLSQMVFKAREGDLTHMIGDGSNLSDFTYVENVAQAHALALGRLFPGSPVAGNVYFITNREPVPFWRFVNSILKQLSYNPPRHFTSFRVAYFFALLGEWARLLLGWLLPAGWLRHLVTRRMVTFMGRTRTFSTARAQRDFAYQPRVPLKEAVARTVAYFRQLDRCKRTATMARLTIDALEQTASPRQGGQRELPVY